MPGSSSRRASPKALLTVAEAMWKERPIVASAVGGIVDQIDDGEHGLLIADPLTCRHSGLPSRRLLMPASSAARPQCAQHEQSASSSATAT